MTSEMRVSSPSRDSRRVHGVLPECSPTTSALLRTTFFFSQKEYSHHSLPKQFLQIYTIRNTDLFVCTVSFYLSQYHKMLSEILVDRNTVLQLNFKTSVIISKALVLGSLGILFMEKCRSLLFSKSLYNIYILEFFSPCVIQVNP